MYKFVFHFSTVAERENWEFILNNIIHWPFEVEPSQLTVSGKTAEEVGQFVKAACIECNQKIQVRRMNLWEVWFEPGN